MNISSRLKRRVSGALLAAVTASSIPASPLAAQSRDVNPTLPPTNPEPTPITAVRERSTPSLALNVRVDQSFVSVGQTLGLTVYLENVGAIPAANVVVRLPIPANTTPLTRDNLSADGSHWEWSLAMLAARDSRTLTVKLQVNGTTDGTVQTIASLSASKLEQPVQSRTGALVVNPTKAQSISASRGSTATSLRTPDAAIEVAIAKPTADTTVTLTPNVTDVQPNPKRGLPPFRITTNAKAGEMTLKVRYTEAQLFALGIAATDLTLMTYDETAKTWQAIPASLDRETRTVTARINAGAPFQLTDGSSPSEAFLPSLQSWQTSLFTGAASSSYPIDVPAGPAGIKPDVALSYSSSSSDGKSGERQLSQAGWVGRDWSLELGSVSANKVADGRTYYSLSFGGMAFDVTRGAALVGTPVEANLSHWTWTPVNESFAKVTAFELGDSTATRGGSRYGNPLKRYGWRIWAKDGTKYEFIEDTWWGWDSCLIDGAASMETYQWLLSSITDVNNNTITYNYSRDSQQRTACNGIVGTVDREIWPTSITWGANSATGAVDRYKVEFNSSARAYDLAFDWAGNQLGGINGAPRKTRQLDTINVLSKPNSGWELVRQYAFTYDYSTYSDRSIKANNIGSADTTTSKLTLKSIQRFGNNGTSALPATTFTYGLVRGTELHYPNGAWNRLTQVNNGQGGLITFAYENIGFIINKPLYANYRRVTSKTLNDGRGNNYPTSYSYTNPALNTLGSLLDSNDTTGQTYVNSAILYYNKYRNNSDMSSWLVHQAKTEFRGHAKVTERDPNGNETDHYFYQGDASCTPAVYGSQMETDACFINVRNREILKGKEYRTVQRQGISSTILRESLTNYTVEFYGFSESPWAGLWRSFDYTNEVYAINRDPAPSGGPTETVNRTKYYYEPANQGGVQYGNVTKVEELDVAGAVYRSTINTYSPNTSSAYIVDRLVTQVIRDGQNRVLALTENRYDNAVTTQAVGTRGLLTLVRKYTNVPLAASTTGVTLTSSDTSYGYDAYGNPITVTTYAQPGTRLFNGTTSTFSAPGNGSTSSTVTTTFDPTFHTFSTSVSQPTGNTNSPTLNQSAGYNYQMGTLTSVTDANGNITNAEYDAFGRMVALIKPGDSSTLPTMKAHYEDAKIPFHYWTETRENSGLSGTRIDSQFYDGLGRKIQTKQESVNGSQTIVVDTKYDGVGQVTHEAQPRYVAETSSSFWEYTAIPGTGVNWTTKTYDSLGRVLTLTTPDGAKTTKRYWQYNNMSVVDTIDPNRHRTQHRSDQFGRLIQVQELSGDCTSWAFFSEFSCAGNYTTTWASYGMTTYAYSPLDLLTTSTDANNNITSMTYDSASRKLTMNDPDMGAWNYSYDVNGNLISQTDAKNQTMSFEYDLLNRVTAKKQGSTLISSYTYDQFGSLYPYGKGRLTTMSDASGSTIFGYTPRGEIQSTLQTIDGTTYSTYNTYRSDGNINTSVYPTGEIITYSYDAAGRQNGLTSNLGEVFQTNVTYDALGQKTNELLGNGQQSTYSYDSLSRRLTSMQTYDVVLLQESFSRAFTYDLAGNVQTITSRDALNPNEIMRYSYDHRDRVTNACAVSSASSSACIGGATFNQSYGYDVIGNITTKAGVNYSYANGKPHAVSSVGSQSYGYDSNGNLLNGGGRNYVWNIENHPSQISTNTVTETYKYDGNNARVKKTTITGSTVKSVLYIGSVEYWSDGKVVSNYAGIAARTTTSNPSASNRGSVIYFHTDHLGSIGAITNSSGTVIEAERYDPWGATRSGNLTSTEFGYTGQRKDDGTGLLFYHARYYDAAIARFTSADTIGIDRSNPQTRNRYAYVLNNPLSYNDPTGHMAEADFTTADDNTFSSSDDNPSSFQAIPQSTINSLLEYGISVSHQGDAVWTNSQLLSILEILKNFISAVCWTVADFKANIGPINLIRSHINPRSTHDERVLGAAQYANITLYDDAFSIGMLGKTVVHEIAHVWDNRTGGALSNGMMKATGSYYKGQTCDKNGECTPTYHAQGTPASAYARTSHREDWAEALVAVTYNNSSIDKTRYTYVNDALR
ncbi:RHS repeat-associated core domain-containing protein [Herpetosiphon geysericola]|uniref:Uncharacterized protein n=1 Tax=Herpetosiphon geysericola TaxID=70996 RepID=A0A0P6XS81_9CHLR|nr:RHS repeat-associated core domain-containing protein [Herpetosiphon geysericola]KPL85683.1 hypothetical protein SE18_15670 [Herpetosiphon geysericola]